MAVAAAFLFLPARAETAGKPRAVEQLTKLLGHEPRTYEDFAAKTAALWKS